MQTLRHEAVSKILLLLTWPRLVALAMGILITGCRTPAEFSPINTAERGWHLQEGQAIWRPGKNMPELAGELILARHEDGRCFLQYAKTPFVMVQIQTSATDWRIDYPPQNKRYRGRGKPPRGLVWFHLNPALNGKPPPPKYEFQFKPSGEWRFENTRTGESLEGYLAP